MIGVEKDVHSDILFSSISDSISEYTGESVFKQIFKNNHTIMLIVEPDENQSILDANEAACNFYGYSHEQFIQLKMGNINTLPLIERQKKMKVAIGKPQSDFNFIHKTGFGVLKNVEVSASPIMIKNKKVMFIIVHDITVQKKVELKLRENQERLSLALEGTDLGMWDWHIQTGEVHYDKKWAEIIGYTLDELSPLTIDTWRDNTHPKDLVFIDTELNRYFTKQSPIYEHESRMKHKGGNWIWVLDRGKVFEWDSTGKPLRMAGTHLDITEKKLTEIELAESEVKFRNYFESSPLSLWEQDYSHLILYLKKIKFEENTDIEQYLDDNPEIVRKCSSMIKTLNVNNATLLLYETNEKENLLVDYEVIDTATSFEVFKKKIISIYRNEVAFKIETEHWTHKGNKINIRLESILLNNYKVLTTITDVTEIKNKEYRLKELLAQSKADTETKGILLREINHRVKNNLSSLIGLLYAEKRKSKNGLEKKQLELLNNLINRVKGISIAHDLLSRSEWKPISIELLTDKIINSLKHLIPSDRSIKTKINKSDVFLDADQSQSMAVLINELFVNSLEHASLPGGTLKVDIKIIEKEGTVSYIYKDNGSGFSNEVLTSSSYNVGLYLIKNIVEQSLRGKITLKNKNGALVEIKFPGGGVLAEI